MIVYYNKWREGTAVQTLGRPDSVIDPSTPPEFAGLGEYETWIFMLRESFPTMTRQYAIGLVAVWVQGLLARGIVTKPAMIAAMNLLVEQYIAWPTVGAVMSVAVWAAVAVLVLAVVVPRTFHGIEQVAWGNGWTLRYKQRLWDASFYYWDSDGMPIFWQREEYGSILTGERHNVERGGVWGDYWLHGLLWQQVTSGWPYWYIWQWWESFVGFVGYCTRWSAFFPLYKLQPQYYGNMPML